MKFSIFEIILLCVIALLGTWGYWGAFTKAGNKYYDEMAGILPWVGMLVAGILFVMWLIFRTYKYLY